MTSLQSGKESPAVVRQSEQRVKLPQLPAERLERVAQIARQLDGRSMDEILRWAVDAFGDDLGFMTALGYSGVVVMDHLRRILPRITAYFIDTGFNFPETLEFKRRLEDEWGVEFIVLRPPLPDDQLEQLVGPEAWKRNPDLCCHYRKVDPMLRVIHTKEAWISAIRRDQSFSRSGVDVVELDGRGVMKIYPMAGWTFERTWEYIRANRLPYNPLHDERYLSVGCTHCTSPVAEGQHERSGRWNSMPKLECGLHL